MRQQSRSRSAWLVLLSMLGAALVAPVIEIGDLLEGTLAHRRPASAQAGPSSPVARPVEHALSTPRNDEFIVVGLYASLGPREIPGPVLEPAADFAFHRVASRSLRRAGRVRFDRGPPPTA
jgi:hypothetical protein